MVEKGPNIPQDQTNLPKPGEFRIPDMTVEEARESFGSVYKRILDENEGKVRYPSEDTMNTPF